MNTTGSIQVTVTGTYSVTAIDASGQCLSSSSLAINASTHPDYLPLVDLFNSTNGSKWINHSGWLSNCDPCNGWFGVTCANGRVTEINLDSSSDRLKGNNLSGTIPESIGELSKLTKLVISFNNQLTGPIPLSISQLSNLIFLDFFGNKLTGNILPSIGQLANIEILHIGFNAFTGSIPESLGNLKKVRSIHLGSNALTGPIPSSFRQLKAIERLALSGNKLTGNVPAFFSELPALSELYLTINQFTGPIPASLGTMTSLTILSLAVNQLSGCIPNSMINLCGRRVELATNPGLPNDGRDWTAFCATGLGGYNGKLYTVKTGSWQDQTTWSCGALPQPGDQVILQHAVTIKSSDLVNAGSLFYRENGKLLYEKGGRLMVNTRQ